MDLNTLWFILIAVLFTGYFILEGFDYGAGILLPILGASDARRRVILNAIGPHWSGNEVWLITAGGAIFAAFPVWYSTLFSGFYLPLLLILIGLILRGIAIEFRSLDANPKWRSFWDWAFFIGSALPALLWGVAFANFVRGVPIDSRLYYAGGFWNLLNPFALVGGLVSFLGFSAHGAVFLSLKTTGELQQHSNRLAFRLWIPTVAAMVLYTILSYFETDFLTKMGVNPGPIPFGALIALLTAGFFIHQKRDGWAFLMTSLTIILSVATIFMQLYPRVLVSNPNPANSLTIYNSASGVTTLTTMSIVAVIFVPIVLAYEIWTFWVFRKRVSEKVETLHY
ncbi:MAG TPA: cytochrome d ubiquinol oxidase subunit II [Anaerolineaceae bacterium]|nr:cytochrome d ubiquinol oxidase subunit II [Anaerolineaceae bacterium]